MSREDAVRVAVRAIEAGMFDEQIEIIWNDEQYDDSFYEDGIYTFSQYQLLHEAAVASLAEGIEELTGEEFYLGHYRERTAAEAVRNGARIWVHAKGSEPEAIFRAIAVRDDVLNERDWA